MYQNIEKLASQIEFQMKQQGDKKYALSLCSIQKNFKIIEESYAQIEEQLRIAVQEFQDKFNSHIERLTNQESPKKKKKKKNKKKKVIEEIDT